jgi:cephalosporin-C deacetylase
MPFLDMPPDQLRAYRPELPVPPDLDDFWRSTLDAAAAIPVAASFEPVDNGLTVIETYDVTFAGYGGSPIKAWLHLPVGRPARLPAVVEYLGYGGGRGLAHEQVLFAAAGFAHLVMDTRGQGSTWSIGDTADPEAGGAPAHPGFMTRGILDRELYYYRRLIVDAVRALDAARASDAVDPAKIAVTGRSQGGALTIAAAAFGNVVAAAPDVPFLSDFPRAVVIAEGDPYPEIARYLRAHRDHVERAFATLAYFDMAILGRRATAPALFSVALLDAITPPSTVYAAFNHYGGPKEIREYPFNDHEGGEGFHDRVKIDWLRERLGG